MPRNTMEYSSHRQEEHRTDHEGEFNTEWQLQALQPFVDHLCHRDPELSQEIARELNAALNPTGEKHHVSWLDGHEQKPDGYNYQERHPTPKENNILMSYLETAHELDDDQREYVSSTLTKALSQRATLTLSENFRKPMDHAASHQDNNVPNPESFNRLMDLAQDHYSKTLSHTEHVLKNSIKLSEDPMVFTKTIDSLIRLEKDMERAATGYIPQHLDMATAMDRFADTYIRRGEQLAGPIINDFREAFPEQEPNPTEPDFIQHFQEKTREYLPGDIHNAANHFAFQYAWNSPNSPDPNSPPHVQERTRKLMAMVHQSLTGQTT